MKINRLETHDRLTHFMGQENDIGKYCQKIIDQRPFGNHPFYIFGHKKTIGLDEKFSLWMSNQNLYKSWQDVPEARLIWQPRLTKPECAPNTMLFKAYPGNDSIRIVWILPQMELWEQYESGKMTSSDDILVSIANYKFNKKKLESKEDDDLSEEAINAIYKQIARIKRTTPLILETF